MTLVTVTHAIEEAAVLGQYILLLGQTPNTSPVIIENLNLLKAGFRESEEYNALCRDLRARLETA